MRVAGTDPDPLFIQEPDKGTMNHYLSTLGLETCDCVPQQCRQLVIAGSNVNNATLTVAIYGAHVMVNQNNLDFQVTVTDIEHGYQHVDG